MQLSEPDHLGLCNKVDGCRASIAWSGPTDATGYRVFRNGEAMADVPISGSTPEGRLGFADLRPATDYLFEVAALDRAGAEGRKAGLMIKTGEPDSGGVGGTLDRGASFDARPPTLLRSRSESASLGDSATGASSARLAPAAERAHRLRLLQRRDGYGKHACDGSESWRLSSPTSREEFIDACRSPESLWIETRRMPASISLPVNAPILVASRTVIDGREKPLEIRGAGLKVQGDTTSADGPLVVDVIVHNVRVVDLEAKPDDPDDPDGSAGADESGRGIEVNRATRVWIDRVSVESAYDEGISISTWPGYDGMQGPLLVSVSHCRVLHSRQGRNFSVYILPNNPELWKQARSEAVPPPCIGQGMLKASVWRCHLDDTPVPFGGAVEGGRKDEGFRGPMVHGAVVDFVNNSVRYGDRGMYVHDFPPTVANTNRLVNPADDWGGSVRMRSNAYEWIGGSGNHAISAATGNGTNKSNLDESGTLLLNGALNKWPGSGSGNTRRSEPASLTRYETEPATAENRRKWEEEAGPVAASGGLELTLRAGVRGADCIVSWDAPPAGADGYNVFFGEPDDNVHQGFRTQPSFTVEGGASRRTVVLVTAHRGDQASGYARIVCPDEAATDAPAARLALSSGAPVASSTVRLESDQIAELAEQVVDRLARRT